MVFELCSYPQNNCTILIDLIDVNSELRHFWSFDNRILGRVVRNIGLNNNSDFRKSHTDVHLFFIFYQKFPNIQFAAYISLIKATNDIAKQMFNYFLFVIRNFPTLNNCRIHFAYQRYYSK